MTDKMQTVDYIKQYSKLYHEYKSNYADELGDLDSVIDRYTYIPKPSRAELPGQIELHMFWQIPLPPGLVTELEYWIRQGVFFESNPDVYYHVDKKYWPLVREIVGAELDCANTTEEDYTWSMDLYKKAPWHFDIAESNYNSLECLKLAKTPIYINRIVDFECFMYLNNIGHRYGHLMPAALAAGNLDCIDFMHRNGVPIIKGDYTWDIPMHVETLKYVCKYHPPGYFAMRTAVRRGNIKCIEYLNSLMVPLSNMMSIAVGAGQFECMKYLHAQGEPWEDAMEAYIGSDILSVIDYIHSTGGAFGRIVGLSLLRDNFEVADYAYKLGAPLDDVIYYALFNARLDYIEYFHKLDAPIGEAAKYAAQRGHIKCLKYLCENGASTDGAMENAAYAGHIHCLRYLFELGASTKSAMNAAAYCGNYDCIVYLHENGVAWDQAMEKAASDRHIKCLEYMDKHGAPRGNAVSRATIYCQWKCLEYLQANPRD